MSRQRRLRKFSAKRLKAEETFRLKNRPKNAHLGSCVVQQTRGQFLVIQIVRFFENDFFSNQCINLMGRF